MSDTAKARLLIVDDEVAQMRALCSTLSHQGYEVVGCDTGEAALQTLGAGSFDVLLTDLMMPGMDGIALLRAALQIDPSLVGILMTGEGTIASAVEAMQSGALDYILKPFKLSAMLPVIARALSVRRLRLENAALEKRVRERTAELLEANKELEAFTYSVSHDLRNPLNAIIGYSALLSEQVQPPLEGPALDFVENIRTAGQIMNALIDDLLKLSQVSLHPMEQREVDLSALAAEIVEALRASAPTRGGAFEIEPGLVDAGDPGLLRVALDNLLGNAWKYTGKRADARIRFGAGGTVEGRRMYEVRDNGAGFDMERAHHMFEPFQRLHSETEFAGTGIGLSIVQRIVQRHGGRIWAEAAVDRGACFYFTLGRPTSG